MTLLSAFALAGDECVRLLVVLVGAPADPVPRSDQRHRLEGVSIPTYSRVSDILTR